MILEQDKPTRGMLDLDIFDRHNGGKARCCSCGWEGVPTHWRGRIQTHCPSCEGFGNEPDLNENPLAYEIDITPQGIFRPDKPPPPPRIKAGRNEPCPCGSGRKYKKCHGA